MAFAPYQIGEVEPGNLFDSRLITHEFMRGGLRDEYYRARGKHMLEFALEVGFTELRSRERSHNQAYHVITSSQQSCPDPHCVGLWLGAFLTLILL